MSRTTLSQWLLLVGATVLVAACAGTSERGATFDSASQDALKQRAQQRWDYLVDKQADKAWEYLTPGYRATVSRERYADGMNNRPIQWKSAKVHKIECDQPDRCTVYVSVTYTAPIPGLGQGSGPLFSPSKEVWLLLGKKWYHLPREGGGSLKDSK